MYSEKNHLLTFQKHRVTSQKNHDAFVQFNYHSEQS